MEKLIYKLIPKKIITGILRNLPFAEYDCYVTNIQNCYLTNYNPITKFKSNDYELFMIFLKRKTWYYMPVSKIYIEKMDKLSFIYAIKKYKHSVFRASESVLKVYRFFVARFSGVAFKRHYLKNNQGILSKIRLPFNYIRLMFNALIVTSIKAIYRIN